MPNHPCPQTRRRSSSIGGGGKRSSRAPQDKFSVAMDSLHVTAVPKSLPCRTAERSQLLSFLTSNIKAGKSAHRCWMVATSAWNPHVFLCEGTTRKPPVAGVSRIGIFCLRGTCAEVSSRAALRPVCVCERACERGPRLGWQGDQRRQRRSLIGRGGSFYSW